MHVIDSPRSVSPRSENIHHWAVEYIGKRYEPGSTGPDSYDCWGLMYCVYKTVFGILLPEYPGITLVSLSTQCEVIQHDIATSWEEVELPFDGCGIAMSKQSAIHHVGVYITADGGRVLHATENAGVVTNTFRQLQIY